MDEFYEAIRSLWVVWLMILFVGILAWVLWPSRRRKWRDAANIPLEDDEPRRRRGEAGPANGDDDSPDGPQEKRN